MNDFERAVESMAARIAASMLSCSDSEAREALKDVDEYDDRVDWEDHRKEDFCEDCE